MIKKLKNGRRDKKPGSETLPRSRVPVSFRVRGESLAARWFNLHPHRKHLTQLGQWWWRWWRWWWRWWRWWLLLSWWEGWHWSWWWSQCSKIFPIIQFNDKCLLQVIVWMQSHNCIIKIMACVLGTNDHQKQYKVQPPSSSSSTSKWVVQIVSFFVSEIERNKSTGNFHKNVFQ